MRQLSLNLPMLQPKELKTLNQQKQRRRKEHRLKEHRLKEHRQLRGYLRNVEKLVPLLQQKVQERLWQKHRLVSPQLNNPPLSQYLHRRKSYTR